MSEYVEWQEDFIVTPAHQRIARKRARKTNFFAAYYALCALAITASISVVIVKALGLH